MGDFTKMCKSKDVKRVSIEEGKDTEDEEVYNINVFAIEEYKEKKIKKFQEY